MRRALLSVVLVALAGGARAEDFTGFYAGINAGHAQGHERDRAVSTAGSAPSSAQPGLDLPPSLRGAAEARRRSGLGSAAPQTSR